MIVRKLDSEPFPEDLPLTASQEKLKSLADEILAFKPVGADITFWPLSSRINPENTQSRLRAATFGDLLLNDGDTLSSPTPSDYRPDLGLYVGKATLEGVGITAWGWEYDKVRIFSETPDQPPPFEVVRYPGEIDWARQIDVKLFYKGTIHAATQSVTTSTSSIRSGQTPSISRDVRAMAYAETGYEGHNQVYRDDFSEDDVINLLEIAREVFDQRVEQV
jgi:hypothetical protein